jgi:hypothetical protein
MRSAQLVLATLTLVGCSHDSAPGPSPVPTCLTCTIYAIVVDESTGECIDGATVQVVSGQSAGLSVTQTTPCDVWNGGGVLVKNPTPSVATMLRATAPGWQPLEKTAVSSSGELQVEVIFALSRIH